MNLDDIREAVSGFVDLVENADRSVAEVERLLPWLLDRLAFAQYHIECAGDETEWADPPSQDAAAVRALVCRRFPNFGTYNVPLDVTSGGGEPDWGIEDAIDDIQDIYCELRDVLWRWENTSRSDALWHLEFSYRTHWRAHLRGVQLYLEALGSEECNR